MIGRTLSHYRFIEKLGQGGMAEVPGLVVEQVDDNKMGKIETFEVRSFGTNID